MSDAFDIDELRSSDTAELNMVKPSDGTLSGWVWTLAGPGHPATIEQANQAARQSLRIAKKKEEAAVSRKKWIEPDRTPDEVREENARAFAARVLGWTPATIKGEIYPFSTENVVKLLLDPNCGRVYVQLLEYFGADDSFMARSGKP